MKYMGKLDYNLSCPRIKKTLLGLENGTTLLKFDFLFDFPICSDRRTLDKHDK